MEVKTVTRADAPLFRHYQLTDDDRRFTAHPRDTLDDFSIDPERRHYAVILEDQPEKPIGFFVLHGGETIKSFAYSDHSVLFRAFSIDHREQGKGYGKAAMLQALEVAKRDYPDATEMVLAVNNGNHKAQSLYEKLGYLDQGRTRMGPHGPQLLYYYPLKEPRAEG